MISPVTAPSQQKHGLAAGQALSSQPGFFWLLLKPPGGSAFPARSDPFLATPSRLSLSPPPLEPPWHPQLWLWNPFPDSFCRSKSAPAFQAAPIPFLQEVFPWPELEGICLHLPELPALWLACPPASTQLVFLKLHFNLLLKLGASCAFDYLTFSSPTWKL